MSIAVFLGPTLPLAEATGLLQAVYLPPARQGDVYRLVRDLRPAAIGLIDGYFHQTAAVWHREILYAMSEGIHVFGASSMGALRAAELHGLGMRGIGTVFEAYRQNVFAPYPPPFERDEEVAVMHGPPETGFVALSDALVDIRATFAQASAEGVIGAAPRDALCAIAARIQFQERTYRTVLEQAAETRIEGLDLARLEAWLRANSVSQKARDGRALLATLKDFAERRLRPFEPAFHFERALVWERFRAACDRDDDLLVDEEEKASLEELRLEPDTYARLAEAARLSHAAAAAAPAALDVPSGMKWLRARHGLSRRVDLDRWRRDNGIDDNALRRLAAREAALAALAVAPPRALLDQARQDGVAARLRARALDKQGRLAALPEAREMPSAMDKVALTAWWFEDVRRPRLGDSLATHARLLGFDNEEAFLAALFRERIYTNLVARTA